MYLVYIRKDIFMDTYKKLYEEDVRMAELKQKLQEKNNSKENQEYKKIKNFIKNFPIELYIH